MLKTAFVGRPNYFDQRLCEWLSEHSDLSLILWIGSWATEAKGVVRRFRERLRLKGPLRAINEFLYYATYRLTLMGDEERKIKAAMDGVRPRPRRALAEIPQVQIEDVRSPALPGLVHDSRIDAMFATCVDAYFPRPLIDAPRLGSFLWHEGFTPEYRGAYPAFWTLVNQDYERLGYTLLRMNEKLDAGEVFVQGRVRCCDPRRDWHSYLGHKSIVDSLPEVERFLIALEEGRARPIARGDARDGYYSYPTATAFLLLMWRRLWRGG